MVHVPQAMLISIFIYIITSNRVVQAEAEAKGVYLEYHA